MFTGQKNLLEGLGHVHDKEHTQSKAYGSPKWKDNCRGGKNGINIIQYKIHIIHVHKHTLIT